MPYIKDIKVTRHGRNSKERLGVHRGQDAENGTSWNNAEKGYGHLKGALCTQVSYIGIEGTIESAHGERLQSKKQLIKNHRGKGLRSV